MVCQNQCIGVFIAQNGGTSPDKSFMSLKIDPAIKYHPFCDDVGPMNMACSIRFIEQLDRELARCASAASSASIGQFVVSVDAGRRPLTNAVMLLGS
jgi:hypothetical protein